MSMERFETALAILCPVRQELRDRMKGCGSLDSFAKRHGVQRHGKAHTAGSDALVTLELYLSLKAAPCLMQTEWKAVNPCIQEEWDTQDNWSVEQDSWYEQSGTFTSGLSAFPASNNMLTQACHPSVLFVMSSLGEAAVPWNATEQAWSHAACMPGVLHVTSR